MKNHGDAHRAAQAEQQKRKNRKQQLIDEQAAGTAIRTPEQIKAQRARKAAQRARKSAKGVQQVKPVEEIKQVEPSTPKVKKKFEPLTTKVCFEGIQQFREQYRKSQKDQRSPEFQAAQAKNVANLDRHIEWMIEREKRLIGRTG